MKPDPTEPWRYVCVDCGSVNLSASLGKNARHDTDPSRGRRSHERRARVRCRACGMVSYAVRDRRRCRRVDVDDV